MNLQPTLAVTKEKDPNKQLLRLSTNTHTNTRVKCVSNTLARRRKGRKRQEKQKRVCQQFFFHFHPQLEGRKKKRGRGRRRRTEEAKKEEVKALQWWRRIKNIRRQNHLYNSHCCKGFIGTGTSAGTIPSHTHNSQTCTASHHRSTFLPYKKGKKRRDSNGL